MIKKRKIQLSDPLNLSLVLFPVFLAGLFVYASRVDPLVCWGIGISVLIALPFLLFFHFHLSDRRALIQLDEQDLVERTNLLESEIQKESRAIQAFQKKHADYSLLKQITEKMCLNVGINETALSLGQEVSRLFCDKDPVMILYLLHPHSGELGITLSLQGEKKINIRAKNGDLFDAWVMKSLKPLLIENVKNDFRFDVERLPEDQARGILSLISVPLMVGDQLIGILRLDSRHEDRFSTEDLRLLTTIGDLGAVALENARFYEDIEDLAIRDGLTRLFLRRHLLDRMSQELGREFRLNRKLSFLMIDLDRFKTYNDTYGHTAGDIVLRRVGRILTECFERPGNVVCRYGGEEFAVLLPDCPKEKALRLAEDLRQKVAGQTVILRRQKTSITVSVGLATFPDDARLKDDLIQKADEALYRAKNEGRNCVRPA